MLLCPSASTKRFPWLVLQSLDILLHSSLYWLFVIAGPMLHRYHISGSRLQVSLYLVQSTTSKFAFFFEEGEGYLSVNNIGHPTNGEVQLARCVADGRLYVRKKTYPTPILGDANSTVATCNEVKFYHPHPHIPKLIDWVDEVYHDSESDRRQRSTASIWEYCSGEDLAALQAKACEIETPIPEAFLWKLLLEVLTVPDSLHFGCHPAICEGDFHTGNISVHWEDKLTVLPQTKLGDSGRKATIIGRLASTSYG